MLKYSYCKEIFKEVPGEIALGISITGCTIHCSGCHSSELWKDYGHKLTTDSINELLEKHAGVSCLLLLGGEHDIPHLIDILRFVRGRVKTAWYCGLDSIPSEYLEVLDHLDYVKVGHYDSRFGGLDSTSTNQRMYKREPGHPDCGIGNDWMDITCLFLKNK